MTFIMEMGKGLFTSEQVQNKIKREVDKMDIGEAIREIRGFLRELHNTCINPPLVIGPKTGTVDGYPIIVKVNGESRQVNPIIARECQRTANALERMAEERSRWLTFWLVLAEGWRSRADDVTPRNEEEASHRERRLLIERLYEDTTLEEKYEKIMREARVLGVWNQTRIFLHDKRKEATAKAGAATTSAAATTKEAVGGALHWALFKQAEQEPLVKARAGAKTLLARAKARAERSKL